MNENRKTLPQRRSIRLKGYDYAQAGLYFITICCQNKTHRFGSIKNGNMILNGAGKIAQKCWLEIPNHFPNVILHEFIIMPNHVHGIIELVGANQYSPDIITQHSTGNITQHSTDHTTQHSTDNITPYSPNNRANIDSPLRSPSKTIGSVIRGYKIGVTKWVRSNTNVEILWQRNYYEHIIRNDQSYETISNYITNNPAKWQADKFFR